MRNCPRCGVELSEEHRFCPNCGFDTQPQNSANQVPAQKPTKSRIPILIVLFVVVIILIGIIGAAVVLSDNNNPNPNNSNTVYSSAAGTMILGPQDMGVGWTLDSNDSANPQVNLTKYYSTDSAFVQLKCHDSGGTEFVSMALLKFNSSSDAKSVFHDLYDNANSSAHLASQLPFTVKIGNSGFESDIAYGFMSTLVFVKGNVIAYIYVKNPAYSDVITIATDQAAKIV